MEEVVFPDYKDSILNLSCSILQHYGITPDHETLPEVDALLEKKYRHVVVILLDGLGMNVLEQNLAPNDFLRRHLLLDYSSVFPPTTTASTTSFLSGKYPIEHGWLGWDLYFEKENKTVTCFTNKLQNTEEEAADYNVVQKYFSYESIIDRINNAGTAKAYGIFPFGKKPYKKLDDWIKAIKKTCDSKDRTFTYAYWENPDDQMHRDGVNARSVEKIIYELNSKVSALCQSLKDSLVIITADHGHRNIRTDFIEEDYPDFAAMLKRPASLEPRAISFYVKEECMADFPVAFDRHFGGDYMLLSKQEVMDKNLFGPGRAHENLTGIGDFIAIATTNRTLLWNKKCPPYKAHHAGMSKEEMRIPLITYKTMNFTPEMIVYYMLVGMGIICLLAILF